MDRRPVLFPEPLRARSRGKQEGGPQEEDVMIDTAAIVSCPYCGADVEITLDPGGDSTQRYVEDCEVCCRPWQLTVRWDQSGSALVEARTDDAM